MISANSFGQIFKITSFGESHGPAMGVVVEGCPSGVIFDNELLLKFLARRRPGQSEFVTARDEKDQPQILSGVFEGKTLGTPIAITVENTKARSQDYKDLKPRLGHADDMWKQKFIHNDPRGGGRSSGRETLSRVIGGSIAQMFVTQKFPELQVLGFCSQMGDIKLTLEQSQNLSTELTSTEPVDMFPTRIPSKELNQKAQELLIQAREQGKSYGGLVQMFIKNLPQGLGQPVFHKFKADLAQAMMSVGATCSFELGAGYKAIDQEGSQFHMQSDSQVYGGVRGGITTGELVDFKVGFKPTSSVLDVAKKGRHDPCIIPRAISVLEAMTWLVLADHILWQKLDHL